MRGKNMNYFTPEWYNDTIVAEMCFQLRKTGKAAAFSEKFFERLYAVEKRAFLKHSKRAAKFEKRTFDAVTAGEQFDANYEENLAFVKKNLPEELLATVADVRVLALGSADYDVAYAITRYCGQINRKCESVETQYQSELEAIAEKLGWVTVNSLEYLVGAPIASVEQVDGAVLITTSPEYSGNAYRVELADGVIDGDARGAVGSTIIKHELTQSDDGFCLGLLCNDVNSDLFTLTVNAKSVNISDID
jgi:hypothetical protein